MNNVLLVSIIALIGIVLWIMITSLIRKIWSFRKKEETKTKSQLSKSTNNTDSSGSMFGIFIFIIFFVGIAFISFKMTMARYKIAGEAIKQGNTGIAAAIMAPEIGQGISSGLSGLRLNIRH